MTNDDTLLAGFLDRSLSEDQLLELEARKAASPEFAHQFSNMLTVESMLASATPKATIPADFLNTVENSVAAKILVGGTAGTSGGFLSGLSSAWSWLGGAALGLVIAGTLYYTTLPASKPVQVVQTPAGQDQYSDPNSTLPEAPVVTNDQASEGLPASDNANVDNTGSAVGRNNSRSDNASSDNVSNLSSPDGDGQSLGNADISANNPEGALEQAVRDYEQAVSSGDILVATQSAITLGKTFRDRNELTKSKEYFIKAVEHARKAKLAAWEVEALGEQAKTSVALGNQTEARLLLNHAISRGSKLGTDVSVWTQMLKDLR